MKTYKPATPAKLGGGSFRNSGQKTGKKAPVGKEKKAKSDPVQAKLRKISKAMFQRRKATSSEGMMRSQLNG